VQQRVHSHKSLLADLEEGGEEERREECSCKASASAVLTQLTGTMCAKKKKCRDVPDDIQHETIPERAQLAVRTRLLKVDLQPLHRDA